MPIRAPSDGRSSRRNAMKDARRRRYEHEHESESCARRSQCDKIDLYPASALLNVIMSLPITSRLLHGRNDVAGQLLKASLQEKHFLFHPKSELPDQGRPFGLLLGDVGGIFLGGRGERIAAVGEDA